MHLGAEDQVRDAVRLVRERRLDEIPVIDAEGRPIGLLDVQVTGGQLLGHVPRAHRLRFALLPEDVDRFRMELLDPAWRSITEDAAITVTYDRSSSPGALALHLGDVPNVFHRTPA